MKCRSEKHPHHAEGGGAGSAAAAASMGGGGIGKVGVWRIACHRPELIHCSADCRYLAFVACPTAFYWSSAVFFLMIIKLIVHLY